MRAAGAVLVAAAVVLSLVVTPGQAQASVGDVDASFGAAGSVALTYGSHVVGRQEDKVLVLSQRGLERRDADGAVDTTFGIDGLVTAPEGMRVTVKDGVILALGAVDGHPAAQRYTTDGDPIGGSPFVIASHRGSALDAHPQGDDLVLFVTDTPGGLLIDAPQDGQQYDGSLIRLKADGSVDPTFGVAGAVPTQFSTFVPFPVSFAIGTCCLMVSPCTGCGWVMGAGASLYGMRRHLDGFLAVVSTAGSAQLRRFTASGLPDAAFHPHPLASGWYDIAEDGRLVLAAGGASTVTVTRLMPNGAPDLTVGPDGSRTLPVPDTGKVWPSTVILADDAVHVLGHRRSADFAPEAVFSLRLRPDLTADPGHPLGGFAFRVTPGVPAGAVRLPTRIVMSTSPWDDARLVALPAAIPPVTSAAPVPAFTVSCTRTSCDVDGTASEDADGDALTFTWRTQHHDEGYLNCYLYNRWAYTATATLDLSPATSGCSAPVLHLVVEDVHGRSATISQQLSYGDEPVAEPLTLTAEAFKEKGTNSVRLTWNDTTDRFDVFRDGALIGSGYSGGSSVDSTGTRGSQTFRYRICRTSRPSECSNEVQVTF